MAATPQLTENDFRQWKLIGDFRTRLAPAALGLTPHPSWENTRRTLQQFDYLSLFLFGLVNPALKSMPALCAASLVNEAVVNVETENLVSAAAAGILSDVSACPGATARHRTGRVRVVTIRKPGGTVTRLVTNFPPAELSARDVQVLCRRPNQRLWERLHLYLLGWATLDELLNTVRQAEALVAKKSGAELLGAFGQATPSGHALPPIPLAHRLPAISVPNGINRRVRAPTG